MKPILVTGGTGFIGSFVVRRLVAAGIPVRALVRNPEKLPPELRDRLEVVVGDITRPELPEQAVRGTDSVIHLAALARAWTSHPREFWEANMEVVDRLLRAAREEGVRSFVHTSTVLGLPPFRPAPVNGAAGKPTLYEETKRAADDLVRAHSAAGFPVMTVRPTRVFGPGPLNDANGVTRLLDLYLRGRFRIRLSDGDVEANYVYVEDVAEGIVRAAFLGRPGADYLLGGDNISFRGFLEAVARVSGVRRRVLTVPWRVGMGLGAAGEIWGRLGGSPSLTRGWIRVFLEDRRADISAARRDLDYRPRSLERALFETLRWLRARETGGRS